MIVIFEACGYFLSWKLHDFIYTYNFKDGIYESANIYMIGMYSLIITIC